MAISATMVKGLRDKSGLPMMECKNALVEAGGDEARALEILKQKSKGKLEKLADRATGEGRVAIHTDAASGKVGLVEVLCETEPVAGTDDFLGLVATAAECIARADNPTLANVRELPLPDGSKTLGEHFDDVVGRIRENIRIANVAQCRAPVGTYVHFDAKKAAVIELSAAAPEELASGICMHIVALNPPHLHRDHVDQAEVARAEAGYREEAAGKPDNIVENIVTGKLNRWFSEFVLLEQPFVKDDKKSVKQALAEAHKDLTVKRFVRFQVGAEPRIGG